MTQTIPIPIIKQVDHILIRVDEPQDLLSILVNSLQLPTVLPVTTRGSLRSGCVSAGGVYLEALRIGRPRSSYPAKASHAQLYGIAFEPNESLATSLGELAARGIPHHPPMPFFGQGKDGQRKRLWTNVLLDGFLGDEPGTYSNTRPRGLLSGLPGKLLTLLRNRRWARIFFPRLVRDSMIFLCERPFDVDQFRAAKRNELRAHLGGALTLQEVKEIIIGVADFRQAQARWQNLMAPLPQIVPGMWRPGDGPAIRLVSNTTNALRALVLKVTSLDTARDFLAENGMLGKVSEQQITIAPSTILSLDILIEE